MDLSNYKCMYSRSIFRSIPPITYNINEELTRKSLDPTRHAMLLYAAGLLQFTDEDNALSYMFMIEMKTNIKNNEPHKKILTLILSMLNVIRGNDENDTNQIHKKLLRLLRYGCHNGMFKEHIYGCMINIKPDTAREVYRCLPRSRL